MEISAIPLSQNNFANHQEIMVSIVVACYNHDKFIAQAIEGFLIQKTNFKVEILINDDASEDRSVEILKEYEDKYPNLFRIFYQKENQYSKGVKPWFHILFPAAKGKYIALCDGDDYWTDPLKLQKQVDFLQKNDCFSGCFHNVIINNEINKNSIPKPWREYTKTEFELIDTFSKTALLHTSSFVFRREFFQLPEWYVYAKSGDMVLFVVIASKGMLKLIPGELSVYRKNENGVTSQIKIVQYHKDRIKLMKLFKKNFNTHSLHLEHIIQYHQKNIINAYKSKLLSYFKRK